MASTPTMKSRTGAIQYCASPRSLAQAKARKESLPYKHIYIFLICGAISFSSWSLLSHHVSSSLPVQGPHSSSGAQGWGSSISDPSSMMTLKRNSRRSHGSLMLAGALKLGLNASMTHAGVVAAAAAAASAKHVTRRFAFQKTKTAMPFIMLTCRMCDDDVSIAVQRDKVYDPVTSTLLEHALSNSGDQARVYVEIGAGTGYFSLLAAAWASDVAVFEPSEEQRVLLQHNAALYRDGRIKVVPYAVGAKTTLAAVVKSNTTGSNNGTTNATVSSSNSTNMNGSAADMPNSISNGNSSGSSSGSNAATKVYGVDVVRLSDAISGGVSVSVLLINAASMDGKTVPDFVSAAEGAYDMLKHVQFVFLLRLPDPDSAQTRDILRNMLQRGNFSNVYGYGKPPVEQQQDDAQWESAAQRDKAAAAEAASVASGAVKYPADAHYVDITEGIRNRIQGSWTARHADFLFTRAPLADTLQINLPKKWDWNLMTIVSSTASPTASNNTTAAPSSSTAKATDGEEVVIIETTTKV